MKPPFRILPQSAALLLAFASPMAFAQAGSSGVIVSEDFESTPVGQIPDGFTKTGDIAVVEGVAHSGTHSLMISPAKNGGRFITLPDDKVAALGGSFWGRLYYKVKLPPPTPLPRPGKKAAILHCTFVAGNAVSPLANDPIQTRLAGFQLNAKGEFHYIYNVQPMKPSKRPEFGTHGQTAHKLSDDWTLLEWHVDNATQTYELFVDGADTPEVSVSKGAGQFEGVEIPEQYETITVGFTNYQPASGGGFTVWIDDVAFGKNRLGPVAGNG